MASSLVNLTPIATALQGYQITSENDMLAALQYLLGGGYTGTIACTEQSAGTPVWQMWLNNPGSNSQQLASVGDWIVITNNAVAKVVSATQFANMYKTA